MLVCVPRSLSNEMDHCVLFQVPIKAFARVFLRTAKEESIFVDAFFFYFSYDTLESMTTFRFSWFYITPNPQRARFGLVCTYEERPSIACFHEILNDTHFCQFVVFFTAWLQLFGAFPGGHGFFVEVAFIFGTKEIVAWILIIVPKRSFLCS